VLKHRQILSIDHPEREEMPAEELNQQIFELSDEAVVSVVRKQLATSLQALLEHGHKGTVDVSSATRLSYLTFGCSSNRSAKLKKRKHLF
jgi:hypothetical protein